MEISYTVLRGIMDFSHSITLRAGSSFEMTCRLLSAPESTNGLPNFCRGGGIHADLGGHMDFSPRSK